MPSFDNKLAFDTLEAQLGCTWQEVYSELGPEPVAAASLGQVYKGVLKASGDVVAVKVPNMNECILKPSSRNINYHTLDPKPWTLTLKLYTLNFTP